MFFGFLYMHIIYIYIIYIYNIYALKPSLYVEHPGDMIISRFFFSLTQLLKSLHLFSSYFTDPRRCPWGKGKGKGKSYEPEPYWGPPSKAQSHRVPAPVDVDLQQNLLSFGMTLDPKNIAIKHRKHLREVLEWMSIGLALGRKRLPLTVTAEFRM